MNLIFSRQSIGYHNQNLAKQSYRIVTGYTKKTKLTYNFNNHFHPYVGFLLEKLSKESLKGLLDSETQQIKEDFFKDLYQPNPEKDKTLAVNYFPKEIDVSENGAYSIYNWELIFHVPFSIAVHLSKNQRFDEAQKWFHYIFDPTSNDQSEEPPMRFWKFKAFRTKSEVELIDDFLKTLSSTEDKEQKEEMVAKIEGWRNKPFQPHVIARTRFVAYQFNVVMKYLDNLIAWGDSLFRQDTIETINEATQLYVLAANILGPKPQEIPQRGTTGPKTFAQLRNKLDAFGNALVDLEGQFPFNLNLPSEDRTDLDRSNSLFGVGQTLYFCIPKNNKLLGYWDLVADRLFKIRNCMNIEGIVRQLPLFQPPIDPGMLVKAAAAGIDLNSVISGLNQPVSPIRSTFLIQKALEICNEVRSLGNNLLSAIEKKNAEELSLIRQQQDIRMQELIRDTRFLQWKESEANTDALLRSRETAYQRYQHYQLLLGKPEEDYADLASLELERKALLEGSDHEEAKDGFNTIYSELIEKYADEIELEEYPEKEQVEGGILYLNKKEDVELNEKMPISRQKYEDAASKLNTYGWLSLIPDFGLNFHFWGIGASISVGGGSTLNKIGQTLAGQDRNDAEKESFQGNLAGKTASYERRADDWTLQSNLAAKELLQIGRQIIASLIREQITKKEYENQLQQIEHSLEINAFLKDKFTNKDLYGWMQSELSKIYYDTYKFAFDIAKKAEQTMKHELMRPELESRSFIQFNYWDAGRKGLLSGENLYLDLKRMEMAYHDYNKREYELTKHISLRQLNPAVLLQLKAQGWCEINLPEWLFDLDCPGHYMRRIKSVALSIPAIAGPYTSINCTLSLQKSTIRKSPILGEDYQRDTENEDTRFLDYFGTIQSIVTSNAQNDSGLFEVNLREERFLPFEGAGVESTWRLELPEEFRQFDYNTITDVILHIRYTARQGGGQLKKGAQGSIRDLLETAAAKPMTRLFSLQHDFPNEWHRFNSEEDANFKAIIKKEHFNYLTQGKDMANLKIQLWSIYRDNEISPIPEEAVITTSSDFTNNLNDSNENYQSEIKLGSNQLDKETRNFMIVSYTIQ